MTVVALTSPDVVRCHGRGSTYLPQMSLDVMVVVALTSQDVALTATHQGNTCLPRCRGHGNTNGRLQGAIMVTVASPNAAVSVTFLDTVVVITGIHVSYSL